MRHPHIHHTLILCPSRLQVQLKIPAPEFTDCNTERPKQVRNIVTCIHLADWMGMTHRNFTVSSGCLITPTNFHPMTFLPQWEIPQPMHHPPPPLPSPYQYIHESMVQYTQCRQFGALTRFYLHRRQTDLFMHFSDALGVMNPDQSMQWN